MTTDMFMEGKKCLKNLYGVIGLNLCKSLFTHALQESNPWVNHECTIICSQRHFTL